MRHEGQTSKRIIERVKVAVAIVAALLIMGLFIGTSVATPTNAVAYIDFDNSGLYLSPPCAMQKHNNEMASNALIRTTIGEARKQLDARPHPDCIEAGGFGQDGPNLTRLLLIKVGILPSPRSRWNPDGSWNW